MKKTFTLVAAAAIALAANAQQANVWSTQEGLEALGLSSDASTLAELTVLASGEIGDFLNAYEDQAKIMDVSANGVKKVIVDGVEYSLTKGTTGSTNPGGIGIESVPTSGWVYQFNVKADGWLTLFSKLTSNKSYYVYEGDAAHEGALINYDLGIIMDDSKVSSAGFENGVIYQYSLPGDDELGYFSMDLPDADKYSDGASVRWIEKIVNGAESADIKCNGFGYISFPVYKDAATYIFAAQGSKANTNGFIYTENKPTQIVAVVPEKTNADTGDVTPGKEWVFRGEGGAGISNVAVDAAIDVNAPVYNVLGQPVSKDTKGLLIQNGRKFYNR